MDRTGTTDDEREAAEARREAERRRADEEKAARAAAKEAQRAERDADRRRRDAERRERDEAREAERRRAERERAVRDAEREAARAQREAEKAAREAGLAEQRAARQIEHARRTAEQAGLAVAADAAPLPPELRLLWPRPAPGRRGPRPGLTLERITEAAVALADAEGLAAVSMARVAESLGVTTMALYRYVPGKEDLLALMYDHAAGPVPPDPDPDAPLRARLQAWCMDQLTFVHAHPWVMDVTVGSRLGPNQVGWLERGLALLDGTPLDPGTRTEVIGALALHVQSEGKLVADYLRQRRRAEALAAGRAAEGPEVVHPALLDYAGLLRRLVTPDSHPAIAAALAAGAFDDPGDDDQPGDEPDVGPRMTLMLDGIEQLVARAAALDPAGRTPGPAQRQEDDA